VSVVHAFDIQKENFARECPKCDKSRSVVAVEVQSYNVHEIAVSILYI
jgi:hypothetical protein